MLQDMEKWGVKKVEHCLLSWRKLFVAVTSFRCCISYYDDRLFVLAILIDAHHWKNFQGKLELSGKFLGSIVVIVCNPAHYKPNSLVCLWESFFFIEAMAYSSSQNNVNVM